MVGEAPEKKTDRAPAATADATALAGSSTPTASDTGETKKAEESTDNGMTLRRQLSAFIRLLFYSQPTWIDIGLIVLGTVAAAAAGTPFPLMGILFGQLVDDMNGATCEAEAVGSSFSYESSINEKVLQIVYIAIGALVLIYTYILCWSIVSQRLAQRLRDRYFHSLLRQEPAFFDNRRAGEVSSRLHGDIQAVQSGTSEKVGIFIACISFFITAYVIAFIKEPRLAGMLVSLVPAFAIMALVGGAFVQKYSGLMSDAIASASSIASEALENVGVVQVFGAGPRLEAKFASHVLVARHAGIRKGIAAAVQAGCLYFVAYAANALAYWQGSRMVVEAINGDGSSSVGRIYTVVFLLVDACVILGSVAPLLPLFGGAASAFLRLRGDIERESVIDGTADSGEALPFDTPAALAFDSVSFAYSSRPDQHVLRNISLNFPAGKHTAIVGPSGSGKSTLASLIARLQNPTGGTVLLDGRDIQGINVKSLRGFIGLVQQEPSLLNRSILENIALGLINSPNPAHAALKPVLLGPELANLAAEGKNIPTAASRNTDPRVAEIVELVRKAAELADVTGFIERLEDGYGTTVGSGGLLVSGGQRQRIALARALVRDPKILMLDEATASLDSTSERRIQAAVERAAENRTVISIAHRLSTIRNADNIIVMEAGEVVEQGTYDELMVRDGAFARMAGLQSIGSGEATETSSQNVSSSRTSLNIDAAGKQGVEAVARTAKQGPTNKREEEDAAGDDNELGISSKLSLASTFKGLAQYVRPSLIWLVPAVIAAVIVGATFSGAGLIFGNTVGALNPCENTTDKILYYGRFFAGLLFMLAVVELFANFVAWSAFGLIAERLLCTIRVLSFRSLLAQPLDWHQAADRSPSGLLSVITKDSAAVGGFSGSIIGTVFSILVNFVIAIVLSHIVAWKIAIVCLVVVPILLGSGVMQLRMLSRYEERHADAYSRATGIAVEAVNSIQTIAALSLEDEVMATHSRVLAAARNEVVRQSALANIWLALSNSTGFLIYAFAYWWGSRLIMKGEYSQKQFFIILVAMLVSAQLWGQMFTLAPEFSRARSAASRILRVINLGSGSREQKVLPRADIPGDDSSAGPATEKDIEAVAEAKPRSSSPDVDGDGPRGVRVTFDGVSFAYAARPDAPVLHDVTFTVQPGQFCGLIGPSGAGKSTIMKLVQGIYEATSGTVTIDGEDLSRRGAAGDHFRDDIAIVPQDTALFDGSVKFNVGLGARPGRDATDAEIEEACRRANIHDTIVALPQGYDTECGPRASQLSGGQRQRLSIARALVRRPRLLLLDESTSALDAESERVLQESLEMVARDITVIAITHRLHTVRKADVIFVVEGGRVVDSGKHVELMERSESYRVNAHQQMLQ